MQLTGLPFFAKRLFRLLKIFIATADEFVSVIYVNASMI